MRTSYANYIKMACLLIAAAPLMRASSVDPRIVIGDPDEGTVVTSQTFGLESDVHGGGVLNFINESGVTFQTLDFFVTLPSVDAITCTSTFYSLCEVTKTSEGNGTSQFDIGFDDPIAGGIPTGTAFSIDLNDANENGEDKGSWGPFVQMQAVANFDIPEPGSWGLALVGLLLCGSIARYRRIA